MRDTGLGKVADKIAKNRRKTIGLLRDLRGAKSVGVIAEWPELGLTEIARPVGVVAAMTPSTNPRRDAGQQHHQCAQGPQRNHPRAIAQGPLDGHAADRVHARRIRSARRAARPGPAVAGAGDARSDGRADAPGRPGGRNGIAEQRQGRVFQRNAGDRRRCGQRGRDRRRDRGRRGCGAKIAASKTFDQRHELLVGKHASSWWTRSMPR